MRGLRHQTIIFLLTIACAFPPSSIAAGNQYEDELQRVEALRSMLKRDGVCEMVSSAERLQWTAPRIRSAYWVYRLPKEDQDRIKLETVKRELGLEIAKALDDEAVVVVEAADSATREAQAGCLLKVSQWLRSSHGYGNLQLTVRADSLAAIPIGHLVADLSYRTNRLETLVGSLMTLEQQQAIQIDVLKEEAPPGFTEGAAGTRQQKEERLYEAWQRGYKVLVDWCEHNGFHRTGKEGEWQQLPADLAFYHDDEWSDEPRPNTTVGRWNRKLHVACIFGFGGGVVERHVRTLYLFRKTVGYFPTKAPKWRRKDDYLSPIQAAFMDAWEPYMKEHGVAGGAAGAYYEQILSNRFMDAETTAIVGASQRQLTTKPAPEK
jgi:hypothetical protein